MAKTSLHGADERPARLHATEARSASWGRHALMVLLASTALAVMALFAALIMAPDMSGEGPGARQMTPAEAGVASPSGQPTGF